MAIVPYLLGFHPTESVVVLFFDRGRVALTARLDLPGTAGAQATVELMAEQIAKLGRPVQTASVVLVCYTDAPTRRPDLERLARDDRLRVLEAVQVAPGRWWSLVCTSPDCCPPTGTPYDLSAHPLCAEAVLAGLSAEPDRAALAAWVAGPAAAEAGRLEAMGAGAVLDLLVFGRVVRQRLMQHLVERSLPDPTALSDGDCAELAALAVDLQVRDVAWALMSRDAAPAHLELWRRVVSRTADPLTPGPLGLQSIAAWLTGNGALLNCGIERLAVLQPEYGLLQVLQDLSWRALPPSAWDDLGPKLRAELGLLVPG